MDYAAYGVICMAACTMLEYGVLSSVLALKFQFEFQILHRRSFSETWFREPRSMKAKFVLVTRASGCPYKLLDDLSLC